MKVMMTMMMKTMTIMSLILTTFFLEFVWILLGENWCWSPLGLKTKELSTKTFSEKGKFIF